MRLELPQRREVEDQRLGQGGVAKLRRQPRAELDGAERVEARLHQRRVGVHLAARHLARHRRHHSRHVDRGGGGGGRALRAAAGEGGEELQQRR